MKPLSNNSARKHKSGNVALLGVLSRYLDFTDEAWIAAIKRNLPEALHHVNVEAYHAGKNSALPV